MIGLKLFVLGTIARSLVEEIKKIRITSELIKRYTAKSNQF